MKVISTKTFKHTLRDVHKNTENRKFCFVMGAGTSRNSGIATGGELAEKWFSEIKQKLDEIEFNKWVSEQKINDTDLAASYGNIYRKRFENDKISGYEFLMQAMKDARPSFGHIVLAQILSRTSGHCVLTTNFDSLVESSVYQFTDKTPLVCGHESLSGYARPSQTHPLIVKIHRDLLLAPKSDPDEISKLDIGWKEPLDHIFSTHIPIIIGYGGNDGSLMTYFENMSKPSNFFWCSLNSDDISDRITQLIIRHEGSFVTIKGFDELMQELLWVFDEIQQIDKDLTTITNVRIQIFQKQLEDITAPINEVDVNLTTSSIIAIEQKELSALEYSTLAVKELDFEKRKEIYLQALQKYPDTDWLWWEFTYFLHYVKKDFTELDMYYQKAIVFNRNQAGFNINYASYLFFVTREYTKAEEFFLRALAINPDIIFKNVNYAIFLNNIKKDYAKAEEYFLKALTVNPDHPNGNGNYAQFLLQKGRFAEAVKYIERAFNSEVENDLLLELWFYRYAHYFTEFAEAESEIERLLTKGVRSINWDLSGNVKQAIKDGHPHLEKLKEFADRISNE